MRPGDTTPPARIVRDGGPTSVRAQDIAMGAGGVPENGVVIDGVVYPLADQPPAYHSSGWWPPAASH